LELVGAPSGLALAAGRNAWPSQQEGINHRLLA
jgi:hypothetical protein